MLYLNKLFIYIIIFYYYNYIYDIFISSNSWTYTISLTNLFLFTQYNTYKCQQRFRIITFEEEQIKKRDREYYSKQLSTTTTNGKLQRRMNACCRLQHFWSTFVHEVASLFIQINPSNTLKKPILKSTHRIQLLSSRMMEIIHGKFGSA